MARLGIVLLLIVAAVVAVWADEDLFTQKIRAGLKDNAADFWIYDDLDAGYAAARKSGKPLLVSFRCVP